MMPDLNSLDVTATHRSLEYLVDFLAAAGLGDTVTPFMVTLEGGEPFSLRQWHDHLERRLADLSADNSRLGAENGRLTDEHVTLEARAAAVDAENRSLAVLRQDADELFTVRGRLADVEAENRALRAEAGDLMKARAELAAAKAALAAIRDSKATKTLDLERDASGVVVRAHVFEKGK